MTKLSTIIFATGAALLATACNQVQRPAPVDLADDTSIRVTGPAQNCIQLTGIRNTDVIDDYTVDFMSGSKTYRNRLPNRCPGLSVADSFTYETSQSQLCNVDIIYPLRNYGGDIQRGAACGLGEFTPIERADRP